MADSDDSPPSHPHRADSGFRKHPVPRGCLRESVSPITVARPHRIFTGFPFVSRIPQVVAEAFRRTRETRVTNRCCLEYSVVNQNKIARGAVVVNQTRLTIRLIEVRRHRTLHVYRKPLPSALPLARKPTLAGPCWETGATFSGQSATVRTWARRRARAPDSAFRLSDLPNGYTTPGVEGGKRAPVGPPVQLGN